MWWTATFEEQWVVSLLPPSSTTPWETALDLVDADLVARDPVGLIAASRSVADVPLPWLPYLAEERSVDEFDSSWPEERQRAMTAASPDMHRVKGVRPALDRALAPMGYQVTVVEWFEVQPTRQRYTFRLSVTIDPGRKWLHEDFLAMIRAANKAKNAHTKLEAIETRRNVGPAMIHVGGLVRMHETVRVGQLPEVSTLRIGGTIHVGVVIRMTQTIRIKSRD